MVSQNNNLGGNVMIFAGVLFLLVNTVLTILMPITTDAMLMATDAFLHRLSAATLLMFMLMIGTYFLYHNLPTAERLIDKLIFGLAFIGCSVLFAHEWAQVFYLHPLAIAAPEGLNAMENSGRFDLYDFEAALSAILYSLGWISFAILLFIRKTYGRLGPLLVIIGFFSIPVLMNILPFPYGAVFGSIPMALGYSLLGYKLKRLD